MRFSFRHLFPFQHEANAFVRLFLCPVALFYVIPVVLFPGCLVSTSGFCQDLDILHHADCNHTVSRNDPHVHQTFVRHTGNHGGKNGGEADLENLEKNSKKLDLHNPDILDCRSLANTHDEEENDF